MLERSGVKANENFHFVSVTGIYAFVKAIELHGATPDVAYAATRQIPDQPGAGMATGLGAATPAFGPGAQMPSPQVPMMPFPMAPFPTSPFPMPPFPNGTGTPPLQPPLPPYQAAMPPFENHVD